MKRESREALWPNASKAAAVSHAHGAGAARTTGAGERASSTTQFAATSDTREGPDGKVVAVQAPAPSPKRKRKKPFEAELALLRELGLR